MGALADISTEANVQCLWEEYSTLAHRYNSDAEARTDIHFCITLTRAFSRWQDAYLALDRRLRRG